MPNKQINTSQNNKSNSQQDKHSCLQKQDNSSTNSIYTDYNITNNSYGLTRQVLQKIREYMQAQKISMSEFARQTGVSKAWLSKLKNTDANLSLNTATDLLHYMGYTLKLTRDTVTNRFNNTDNTIKEASINFIIQPTRLKKLANHSFNNILHYRSL